MAKRKAETRRPTDAEFVILRALWDLGSATVREVYDHLNQRKEIGYTTVLKLMQIMTEKGLLEKDASTRPQIYQAADAKETTQENLVKDLAQRAFGGSAGSLVLQALNIDSANAEELREIRELLNSLEKKGGGNE